MPDVEGMVTGPPKLTRRTLLKGTAGTVAALAAAGGPPWLAPAQAAPPAIKTLHADLEQTGEAFGRGQRRGVDLIGRGEGRVLVARPAGGAEQIFVSAPLAVAFPITEVGAHWDAQPAGGELAVDLRTSPDGAAWTAWVTPAIEADAGEAPHPDTFATLVGAERARWVQYRVRFTVAGGAVTLRRLTLTCLNSVDGEQVHLARPAVNVAAAAAAKPPIVSRAGWGCYEGYRFNNGAEIWPRQYQRWTKTVVHHTATTNSYTDAAAQVRAIYYYHAVTQGWGDIGYNALIGNDGRIYEGRKGLDGQVVSLDLCAGHVYLCNYGTMGISMIGNFSATPLPAHMLDAGAQLAAWACGQRSIDPLGAGVFTRGDGSTIDTWNILGHRQIASPRYPTSCPGDAGASQLPDFRQRVARAAALSAEASEVVYFPETGHTLRGIFLNYWRANGGLAVFGYPITAELQERNAADGQTYTVQYFERQRFEYHPQNSPPYHVLLSLLGWEHAHRRGLTDTTPFRPVSAKVDCEYFPETGHNLCSGFRSYWHGQGLDFGEWGYSYRESLALFGYPISEEFRMVLEDGREYTVQYFERARLERHPQNQPPYDILQGRLAANLREGR